MENKTKDPLGIESMMNTWAQPMDDIMGAMSQIWSAYQSAHQSGQQDEKKSGNDTMAGMNAVLKNWQTIILAIATPESMASLFKGTSTMPEMVTKVTRAVMGSLSEFQKKMNQGAGRFGEFVASGGFEKIDKNIFHIWTDIYENEFQKFFNSSFLLEQYFVITLYYHLGN